jgi:hypothetical protein
MFARLARSFELTKQSYRVLMQDKELLLLPVLSTLAILVVVGSFVVGALAMNGFEPPEEDASSALLTLVFYIASYTIAFFFQAALIAGASERMRGGDPTLGSALGAALRRAGPILAWGVVAGTVGMIIKSIQERGNLVTKIVMALVGTAWSLATWFMVPVLVLEDRPLGDSFRRSVKLFKETWGETMVGNLGLGAAQFVAMLAVIAMCAPIFLLSEIAAIVLGVVALIALGVFFSALGGVYTASLYRYATTKEVPDGFDARLLAQAFRPKAE